MQIRVLGSGELDETRDIRSRAFGRLSDSAWAQSARMARPALEAGRQFAGFEGGRIVATGRLNDLTQWWQGRAVSVAGVGGVAVAPEARGRGLGRALLTDLLERCVRFGHPLAMLYPATTPLYRSLGWEHAGGLHHVELPAEALRTLAAERVPVRRVGPQDAEEVAAVVARVHEAAGDCGPIGWRHGVWRVLLGTEGHYTYLAEDGFVSYRWDGNGEGLEVTRLVAGSEGTLRALWALVGSGSSTAASVRACVAPSDPVLWAIRERECETVDRRQWMLRVVDAPAAIGARGFPAGVSARAALLIDDPDVPANAGHWHLTVEDGTGRLERSGGDPDPVRLGARGLAALYAGVPVPTLRRAGLLHGGDAGTLGAAFAATPYALDYF
ncbi:GNAT family N-acetyltransferase [Spirillospora albida]|uniref:GNAT family N-acetyltransferase n=1 Tax=Spirillospora albida TaxID=58123 RepID=UPI0004C002A2|nr:GNAT family N-acetyltransferase [Spirillospora albida]